jgi:hypothetical protein
MRTVLQNILLMFFGGLVAVLGAEGALRAFNITFPVLYVPDPVVGAALLPHARASKGIESNADVEINSHGQRDREHPFDKTAGVYRIAVLGDSYAEAIQVPVEQTFWAVLERKLERCASLKGFKPEVINFGVSGYGTAQELLILRHRVWQYSPDAVLLTFTTGNDVRDNSRALDRDTNVPYFVLEGGVLSLDDSFLDTREFRLRQSLLGPGTLRLINSSALLQLVNRVRYVWKENRFVGSGKQSYGTLGLDSMVYVEPHDEAWRDAWRVTEALIRTMHREVRDEGARFFMATLTNPDQVHPDPNFRRRQAKTLGVSDLLYPERRLRALADHEGFPLTALAEPLRAFVQATRQPVHIELEGGGYGHWNERGHSLAGTEIARMVCDVTRVDSAASH